MAIAQRVTVTGAVKVSIKDISRVAGVSHSTVSRALSDSSLVKSDTKARIRGIARDMGYSPDARARSLVIGRTRTVGVVVTTITDPFIAEVVQGIESTAYAHGYSVILTSSDADPQREIAAAEMLRSMRVDGVVVTSSRVGALYRDRLEQIGVPVVLLNSHSEQHGRSTYSVRVDDRHGGRIATEHLIQLGHRRIVYISGGEGNSTSAQRMAGYADALVGADVGVDLALVIPGTGRASGAEQALYLILALPERPTAVFCYNDMTAIGLLREARSIGLTVPRDLAVVGFDDIPFASYVNPPLTTIAQPKFELGQQAMEMVLALIKQRKADDIVLQGQLIVRESSVGCEFPPRAHLSKVSVREMSS